VVGAVRQTLASGTHSHVRGPSALVVVALLGLVVPLAAFAPHAVKAWQKDAWQWDRRLSEFVHAYENEDTVFDRFDVFGVVLHPAIQAIELLLLICAGVVVARRRKQRLAAFVLLAAFGAMVLTPVFKELIARPPVDPAPGRGTSPFQLGGGYSFPSGHAFRSMVFGAALVVALWPTRWRWYVVVGSLVMVVATGVGVVYHEWHWATDVSGGWLLAIAWVTLAWLVFRPGGGSRVSEIRAR